MKKEKSKLISIFVNRELQIIENKGKLECLKNLNKRL